MVAVRCPYCGADMRFRILGLSNTEFCYECRKCHSRSPVTIGKPQEKTIELALRRATDNKEEKA